MIVRKVTAHCDWPECDATQEIDPNEPQLWNTLRRQGWTLVTDDNGIKTICPNHLKDQP